MLLARVTDLKTSFLRSPALGACIEGTCARVVYSVRSTCVKGASTKGIGTEGIILGMLVSKVLVLGMLSSA